MPSAPCCPSSPRSAARNTSRSCAPRPRTPRSPFAGTVAADAIKAQEKDKEIGEDDARVSEKQLDAVTKKYTELVDELLKAKEAELLAV